MPKYTGNEGSIIPSSQIKKLRESHKKHGKDQEKNGHHFIESEFFGLETFKKLLEKCGGEPVGFRVFYGNRNEDRGGKEPVEDASGKPTPRIIIIPVDAEGNNLMGGKTAPGHKDGDSDEDGGGMGDGPTCPQWC
jgi:hypothetical protein